MVLGATQEGAPSQFAGLASGIALVAIHTFGINITAVSGNPARSLGPGLIVGGQALSQVSLFLVVPTIAGLFAGALFRTGALASQPLQPVLTGAEKSKAQTA